MSAHDLLVYAHLLAFTFWLGADLGVAVLGQAFRDTRKSIPIRLETLRLLALVDMGPRTAWVAMVPLSIALVDAGGWWDVPLAASVAAWLVGAGWLWLTWAAHARPPGPERAWLQAVELWVKAALGLCFGAIGLASVLGFGPLPSDWLGWKALLFGVLFAVAGMIDVAARPTGPLLAAWIAAEASPETERPLRRAMDRTRLWVRATYALLFVIAFLGNVKPG